MKTKIWAYIVLAFFVAGAASATELPKLNVVQVEENAALVAYRSPGKAPLQVTLARTNGEILFYKQTKHQSEFKKIFNFSELGDGEFRISINYGNQSINRKVTIKGEEIAVSEATFGYEPFFRVNDRKIVVSFLNTLEKPVVVTIYQNGKHIDRINLGRDLCIQKALDFSNLKRGIYELVLSDDVKDYVFETKI